MEVTKKEMRDNLRSRFNPYKIGTVGAILVIAYFLITEHRAHVVAVLPYLFILACPLLHLFMHSHHDHSQSKKE